MPTTDEVLAQIDSAVHDWTVSGDAMRSRPTPEPAPAVPLVPAPPLLVARAELVHRLVTHHDMAPETAQRALTDALEGRHTEHTAVIHAEARAAVAERAHIAGTAIAHFLQAMRPALQAMAEAARQAGQAMRAAAHIAEHCHAERQRGRPAWQSPYGPRRGRKKR
ncbi:hypothetical protein ABZZ79_03360 [Streptomyces sp. NPDC006458]|uniref:hypothetical protein n=1 Tax=Streptomyces sp. NPDC006458 TaxID=3154302 RepID=UPI0033A5C0DE